VLKMRQILERMDRASRNLAEELSRKSFPPLSEKIFPEDQSLFL